MRQILFFIRHGFKTAWQQWSLAAVRIPLFSIIVVMWAYTWSMMPAHVYATSGMNWAQITWYITLTEIVYFSGGSRYREVEYQLRDGQFQTHLTRPFSWLRQWLLTECGALLFNVPVFATAGCLLAVIVTHQFLITLDMVPWLAIKVILSTLIWTVIITMVGLSSLWFGSASVPYWLVQKACFVFGALIVPLALYPGWLAAFAHATPFPAVFSVVGNVILPNTGSYADGIFIQVFMLALVTGLMIGLWRMFEAKLVREG